MIEQNSTDNSNTLRYWYHQPMSSMGEKKLQSIYLDAITMNDWVAIRAIHDEIEERGFSLPSLTPTLSEAWNEFVDVAWTQPIIRPIIRLVTRALAAIARML